MGPVLAAIGPVMSFMAANAGTIGTAVSAIGTVYGGVRAAQGANAQADARKAKGEQEKALAQRKAIESRRQKDIAAGRARAVAAASGGGTTDTAADIMTGIEQRGEYNALMDMYNGEVARTDLYNEASTVKAEGKTALIGSAIDAVGTVYSDYGRRRRASSAYAAEMGA